MSVAVHQKQMVETKNTKAHLTIVAEISDKPETSRQLNPVVDLVRHFRPLRGNGCHCRTSEREITNQLSPSPLRDHSVRSGCDERRSSCPDGPGRNRSDCSPALVRVQVHRLCERRPSAMRVLQPRRLRPADAVDGKRMFYWL